MRQLDEKLLIGHMQREIIYDAALQLYLPLWHPELKDDTIISKDQTGHSCEVTGAVWGNQGRTFDGLNDKIALPIATFDDIVNGTLEAWFKAPTTGGANKAIFNHLKTGASNQFVLFVKDSTGKLSNEFLVADVGEAINSDSALTAGTWYHAVVTFGAAGRIMYLDAVAQTDTSTQSDGWDDIGVSTENSIGVSGAAAWFNDIIGEVRIYSRVLSAFEIYHNYEASRWRYV